MFKDTLLPLVGLALQRWQGVLLLMAGAAYFAYDLIDASRQHTPEQVEEANIAAVVVLAVLAHGRVAP